MTGPLFFKNVCILSHHAASSFLLVTLLLSVSSILAFPVTNSLTSRSHLSNGQTDKKSHSSNQARRFYRETLGDDPEDRHDGDNLGADLVRTKRNDWRQHLFPSSGLFPVTDQDKVDEYLEFLDKRYHRLYDSNKSTKKQFAALNWLMGDADVTNTDSNDVDQYENALFVLGVAELASDRLLQNLQIRVQQEKEQAVNEASGVIDSLSTSVDVSIKTKIAAENLIQAGSTVLSRISASRAALIGFQERQLARAFRFSFQTIAVGPVKAFSAIWNFGGGKKSITLTLSVLTAILVFLGPLLQAVVKNLIVSKQSS